MVRLSLSGTVDKKQDTYSSKHDSKWHYAAILSLREAKDIGDVCRKAIYIKATCTLYITQISSVIYSAYVQYTDCSIKTIHFL